MKKRICALLCLALTLGLCAPCFAEASQSADAQDGWLLSEAFVPRVASEPEPEPSVEPEPARGEPESQSDAATEPEPTPQPEPEPTPDAPQPEPTPQPDAKPQKRDAALSRVGFRQDGAPRLEYNWDANTGLWSAEPMRPEAYPIYAVNNSDQTLGPFAVVPSAQTMLDAGGLFRLDVKLLPEAGSLTLLPGQSACVGVFEFSAQGGETATACQDTLAVQLRAQPLDE